MLARILETKVSAVKGVRAKRTTTLTLGDAIKAITGTKYAGIIQRIRELQEAGNTEEAKKVKVENLAAVLFSGTFSARNKTGLEKHCGLLVLDFDDCGVDKKAELAADPHSVLCFASPRGTGLKLVVRVEPAADAEEHGESFDVAKAYFFKNYGIDADPSGRDVCRLCFFSHDPDAIFQDAKEVLHRPYRPHMTIKTTHDHSDNTSNVYEARKNASKSATHSIEEIIEMTQPTQAGQRHRQVFNLARGLKFECALANESLPELKKIVRLWYEKAKPRIETQSFSESWSDFVHAWPRAENPLSTNALTAAWSLVLAGDLPALADEYDEPRIKRLVGLCYHLGWGHDSFYLSTHKAGALLDAKPMQVLRWLRMLQADAMLKLISIGNRHSASTYQWTAGEEVHS